MLYKIIAVALIPVLLHSALSAQTQPQSPTQTATEMQQVLRKAHDKDKVVKVILNRKIDNQKQLTGRVGEISDTSFTVTDQKTGNTIKVDYENVRQIKQKGSSKGWVIALVVIAGVVIAVVAATKPWQSE